MQLSNRKSFFICQNIQAVANCMKRIILPVFFLIAVGCNAPKQIIYRLEPSQNEKTFTENGQSFAWENIDNVIVSAGFDANVNNESILEITIDNHTDSTFDFDPTKAYLFRYSSDTALAEPKIYFAVDPGQAIDSIQKTIVKEDKNIHRNAIFSILLAAAYLTTEVVAATSDDISYNTMEAVRATHDLSQMMLNEASNVSAENINQLSSSDAYWHCEVFKNTEIQADTFYTGKIHFKVPYSALYKVYIPVNGNTYRFEFKSVSEPGR
jgi:hypothetical protein